MIFTIAFIYLQFDAMDTDLNWYRKIQHNVWNKRGYHILRNILSKPLKIVRKWQQVSYQGYQPTVRFPE